MKYHVKFGRQTDGGGVPCFAVAEYKGTTVKGWGSSYESAEADLTNKLRLMQDMDAANVPPDKEIDVK